MHRKLVLGALLVFSATALAQQAQQPWPSRPVKIIAANSAGGAPDLAARVFNESLSRVIGKPVTIENRPGADGYIAADVVMRAEPDGHTLFFATQSLFAIDPFVKKKQPLDPMKAFVPLAVVFDDTGPTCFFVSGTSPFKTWQELMAFAKENPNKLDYAVTVPLFKMLGQWVSRRAGIAWQQVPYKSGSQANQDVVANRVNVLITAYGPMEPQVKAGKLRPVVLTKPTHGVGALPLLSDFYPGFSQPAFVVLVAPAGLPAELAQRINRAAAQVVESPSFNKDMASVRWVNHDGARTVEGTMDFIKARRAEWERFIKEAGIEAE